MTDVGQRQGPSLDELLQDEQQVKRYASYLHANIPLREAVQLDKRVNYFRGKKLMEVLCTGKAAKNKPPCETEEDAKKVGLALLRMGLIHASEVADKKRRILRPIRTNEFDAESYLTWIYQGSNTMRNMLLALLIISVTAMCLFPVWPQFAKVGIWYVSVTILIFLVVLFSVRLLLYIIFWTVGFEFWILPNFFDDDLGVADSFRPIYSFEVASDLQQSALFRVAGAFVIIAFAAWCYQQPAEFDALYAQQMEFLAELYDGKLLSSKPSQIEEAALKAAGALPKLEDLERQIAEDEASPDDDDDDDDSEDDSEDELVKLRRAQKLRQQQFGKPGLEPASSDDEDDSESEDELVKMRRAQKLRAQSKISTSTKENEDVSSDDDDDDDDDDEEDDEEEEEGDKLSKQLLRAAPNSSDEEDAEEDEDEDSEEEAQPEVSLVDELRDTLRDMPMQELAKLKREGLNGQPLHKALDLPGPEYINAWLSGNVDLDTIKAAAANNRKRSRPSTRGEQETAEDVDSGSDDDSNNVAEGSDGIHKTKKQRNAPKEISAKHQVSRFRHVIKAPNRERRDPRFMNMGGDKLDSNVFEGRYGFLEEMRDKEIDELNNALRSDRALKSKSKSARKHSNHRAMSEDERHAAMAKLTKMQQERSRSERDRSRRDIKRDLKKQELDKVAKGKKAFFTKEADLRKLELQKRYQDLQSKGKLDKFLEKRRKKLASKDRKILPKSRPPLGI
mmetsp:Transcript_3469/g.6102  ORF Transcript_3469/g.6102 Transcript_3469/m.6102 type:complete len:732 (+) Transcript_3469:161-2356(+)